VEAIMTRKRQWVELTDWQISALVQSVERAQKDFHLEHASAEHLLRLLVHSDKVKLHVKADKVQS
jgi:hypothetical protein